MLWLVTVKSGVLDQKRDKLEWHLKIIYMHSNNCVDKHSGKFTAWITVLRARNSETNEPFGISSQYEITLNKNHKKH